MKGMMNLAASPGSPISELLTRPALTIAATGSLGDAARAMRQANVSCALTDDGRIVTERDLTRGLAAGLGARDPVDEIAVPDPVAVVASLPVLHAAELMAARQIRHLVLTTDRGDPLGIVSIRDIVGVLILSAEPALPAFLQQVVTEHSEIWLG